MARSTKGNLTGKAAVTQRRDDTASALEDSIHLSKRDHMEVDLSVARKMYQSCKKNGLKKEARKFYMKAYRLQKKLNAPSAPTPPETNHLTPHRASEVLCAWMGANWNAIPEVRF